MKKSDPRLPSINDLLTHPTVTGLVDRLNQTTIAQRASGFLDELRQSVSERTPRGMMLSVEEVAQRFARRLLGSKHAAEQTINATGVVGGDPALSPPLAEQAMHRMILHLGEYHPVGGAMAQRAEELLRKLSGAQSACVCHSFAAAVEGAGEIEAVVARDAGILDPSEWGLAGIPTLQQSLESASCVVADASGMIGGPRCGVIVGDAKSVGQVQERMGAEALEIDAGRLAALVATLEIYHTQERMEHQIPIVQLLSTPAENLKQRCERLAPLIADIEGVASAEPRESESVCWKNDELELQVTSWSIAVQFTDRTAEQVAEQLAGASPCVLVRLEGELLIDLRSVFPRWDQAIVAAVEAGFGA